MKKYHYVYKTTCVVTHHFYFGVHSTNILNDDYIGSGIKFMNYAKKYGKANFSKEILMVFDTRDEAFDYERKIVTENILHNKMCLNLTKGGKGYAHKYNETCRQRMSATKKARIASGDIIPTKHSEEHKQQMRLNNPGGKATSKQIYQINPVTGGVIKMWDSSRKAGISLNIKTWRNISVVANDHKNRIVGGYYWRWVGDTDVIDGHLIGISELNRHRTDRSLKHSFQVNQLDCYTRQIIHTWKTQTEAAEQFGVSYNLIYLAIKTGKLYKGFYWEKA